MKFFLAVTLLATLSSLTGCLYRMPTDDCISTLPVANNPQTTNERPRSIVPGQ